ncbi:uncharacterized radical SAM protein YgiQ [Ectothiorhodospira mobilis]|uniref:Uncharacterized radical SAM protein YgiQ n=1 Tax=Ectothiorhodospira mobilis TaxID=195064 RepID=A0A1I4RZZ5_ECTMO|nr:YgiQ family radical SAM protein [Ectothiorhodospira mobilis]SFM57779.1 uncharacterized radical SAM protein YgiQ [Ectothiorhodospira mobilis]
MTPSEPSPAASASPLRPLFSHRPYWAARFGVAPFLPMSRAEMDELGWDSCDVILVTGDAYVDHPSFGVAIIGRLLEAHGFRVGVIAQPDWRSAEAFTALGPPNLFFGITAGNMDSMVNRYTADRRIRRNDAYSPDDEGGRRPDRAVIVYSQRAREAYRDVPILLGGIEASLRRVAHYDYWSDKVRRSVLLDAKADLLLYGNAERALVEAAHRIAAGEPVREIRDLRGTAFALEGVPEDWHELDSTCVDRPGPVPPHRDPYCGDIPEQCGPGQAVAWARDGGAPGPRLQPRRGEVPSWARTVIRLPDADTVSQDPVLYAHAARLLHLETNPGNARALVQAHAGRDLWVNPPPIPLTTAELDTLFDLPFARAPHPAYRGSRIPAWEMIRFSVNIMRGCFGGCSFCSITEHEGRIIQSRSEDSVVKEVDEIRDRVEGFTGIISDLGGPTANMYRMGCRDPQIQARCRRLSCVFPRICPRLDTDHGPLIQLYRRIRGRPGIKKVLIASGVRYDLAIRSKTYVRELVTHHVGGYLKIAPEHTESGPLEKMMKPGMDAYDRFKALFEHYSREAGKEQYLVPYFIAAHPGTTDADMLQLALWLKDNGFRPDQVQGFLPGPMALATTIYHTGLNPLKPIRPDGGERVHVARGLRQRRLHKAFLRYHDPENWPLLRKALQDMGRADLIGNGKRHLVPRYQPQGTGRGGEGRRGPAPARKGRPGGTARRSGRPPGKPPRRSR